MVIWYWYRKLGKEAEFLRTHDVTKPVPKPFGIALLNHALEKAGTPVRYARYKAEYDPQTKQMLAVRWEPIIGSLLAGRPVIYFSDITEGKPDGKTHAFVLTGYDKSTRTFYANDTYFRKIPVSKDKNGHLIWSKKKLPPINVHVLGNEANPVELTVENLDKHKRPNAEGCVFYYSPVGKPVAPPAHTPAGHDVSPEHAE
jgi:hypothetical protein